MEEPVRIVSGLSRPANPGFGLPLPEVAEFHPAESRALSCACLTPRGSTGSTRRAGLSRDLWIVRDGFVSVSDTVTQLCNAARRVGRSCAMRGNGRFVYDFDEPSGGGRELLGGKGVGLAEM